MLNHPKHITHILHHDSGDVGDGVDVVFCVIGEAGTGDEVKVFEDGVEAFGCAGQAGKIQPVPLEKMIARYA